MNPLADVQTPLGGLAGIIIAPPRVVAAANPHTPPHRRARISESPRPHPRQGAPHTDLESSRSSRQNRRGCGPCMYALQAEVPERQGNPPWQGRGREAYRAERDKKLECGHDRLAFMGRTHTQQRLAASPEILRANVRARCLRCCAGATRASLPKARTRSGSRNIPTSCAGIVARKDIDNRDSCTPRFALPVAVAPPKPRSRALRESAGHTLAEPSACWTRAAPASAPASVTTTRAYLRFALHALIVGRIGNRAPFSAACTCRI